MSCFMLENRSFSDLVRTFEHLDRQHGPGSVCVPAYYVGRDLNRLVKELGFKHNEGTTRDPFEYGECNFVEFVQCLRDWNYRAYSERYSGHGEPLEPWEPWEYSGGQIMGLHQLLKTLQCLEYQCIDSSDFVDGPIRKALKELQASIALALIDETEEYKTALWG